MNIFAMKRGVIICIAFSFSIQLFSAPPKQIPEHLRKEFTLDGVIPVIYSYADQSQSDGKHQIYTREKINKLITKAKHKETWYYGKTDTWLYKAFEKYPPAGKTVLIIGSQEPWYESIVLAYGGHPITVEYNQIINNDSRLTIYLTEEFDKAPQKCDIVLSISSTEHDGLGRYGDPINPYGDFEFMTKVKETYLKEDGHLILAVPVGQDALVWNLHRIYGRKRLPMLLEGWTIDDSFDFNTNDYNRTLGNQSHQPIFYLSPN